MKFSLSNSLQPSKRIPKVSLSLSHLHLLTPSSPTTFPSGSSNSSFGLVPNPATGGSLMPALPVPDPSPGCGVSASALGPGYCPHRNPVRVFLSDLLALRAALLERMLLFIHELHPPGNRAGPGWAEGSRGRGPGRGAAATAATRGLIERSDPRTYATSLFTNPAPDHPGPPACHVTPLAQPP